jgi:hypothetical protein
MVAQEDSLLSPITAAADRSESTTLLVSEVLRAEPESGLPVRPQALEARVLQQARASGFEDRDGARPPPLALLQAAQVLQSITGHEISNL